MALGVSPSAAVFFAGCLPGLVIVACCCVVGCVVAWLVLRSAEGAPRSIRSIRGNSGRRKQFAGDGLCATSPPPPRCARGRSPGPRRQRPPGAKEGSASAAQNDVWRAETASRRERENHSSTPAASGSRARPALDLERARALRIATAQRSSSRRVMFGRSRRGGVSGSSPRLGAWCGAVGPRQHGRTWRLSNPFRLPSVARRVDGKNGAGLGCTHVCAAGGAACENGERRRRNTSEVGAVLKNTRMAAVRRRKASVNMTGGERERTSISRGESDANVGNRHCSGP